MKIIDLLNKIANGEEVPKTIKYNDVVYKWGKEEKRYYKYDVDYIYISFDTNKLDDEVEIIEEQKEQKVGIDFGSGESRQVENHIPYID